MSRYAFLAAVVVGLFFLLSFGDNKANEGDNLRSGQAKRPSVVHSETGFPVVSSKEGDQFNSSFDEGDGKSPETFKDKDTDLDMEETVQEAEDDFARVVRERIEANQGMLASALKGTNELIRSGLDTLFKNSDDFDEDDIEKWARKIESRLTDEINAELKSRADQVKQDKTGSMESAVDLDTEGGSGPNDKPIDLKDQEQKLLIQLKEEIDDIAAELRTEMKHRGAVIEKDILEAALEEKFKVTYVVVFKNDEVVSYKKKSTKTSSSSRQKSSSSSSISKTSKSSSRQKSSSSSKTSKGSSGQKSSSGASKRVSGKSSSSSRKPSSSSSSSSNGKKTSSSSNNKASSSSSSSRKPSPSASKSASRTKYVPPEDTEEEEENEEEAQEVVQEEEEEEEEEEKDDKDDDEEEDVEEAEEEESNNDEDEEEET